MRDMKTKKEKVIKTFSLVSRMRLELTRVYHTPLKRTRLPIPPPRRNTCLNKPIHFTIYFVYCQQFLTINL